MADDPPPASLKDDGNPDEDTQQEETQAAPIEEKEEKKKEIMMSAYGPEIEDYRKVTYRDFSHVKTGNLIGEIKTYPANKEATFPMKLHVIISSPEFWEITWLPHGRSWRINNPKSFEERVLPVFFRHGRYTSFARQVNGWGFRRITHGSDFNSYYHEMFLRGMPHLCERMKRLTNKDDGARKRAEEEKTPDLAAISKENPVPEEGPMLPPSAVALSAPSTTTALPARTMDNYLNRLSENGGINAYIQSLSDAEISFLARRQMFRPEMPAGMFDPYGAPPTREGIASVYPGVMGYMGMGGGCMMMGGGMPMGPNPAVAMRGMPDGVPLQYPNDPRRSMSSPSRPAGAGDSRGSSPPNAAQQANMHGPPHRPQQGNPVIDQFINRASDSELTQLVAMHDAGRRQQQQLQFRGFDS